MDLKTATSYAYNYPAVRLAGPHGAHAAIGLVVAENDRLRELLKEVSGSGIVFDDERIGYLEVQIDRSLWKELQQERHND